MNDFFEKTDWTWVRLPPAPLKKDMNKSEILKKETDKLLEGLEKIELRFRLLAEDPAGYLNEFFPEDGEFDDSTILNVFIKEPLFFDNRSADCIPLIANCILSLEILPPETPPQSKIRRSQYEEVSDRLENLRINFAGLQDAIGEAIAGDVTALATIVDSLFSIIDNFVFMKFECEKIKKAMTF